MAIEDVDDSSIINSNYVDTEEGDIEEIYTPDALAAAVEKQTQHDQTATSTQSSGVSSSSESLEVKDHYSSQDTSSSNSNDQKEVPSNPVVVNEEIVVNDDSPQDTSLPTNNIRIVETSDEEFTDEPTDSSSSMRRIDIVCEDTDSEDEDCPHVSPSPEQIQDSNKLKQEGNVALKEQRYQDAIKFYSLALDMNPNNTAAMNNKSIVYIKMEDWKNAVKNASLCLAKNVGNTKALYHRGYACMMLVDHDLVERYKEALVDFEHALSLQPPKDQVSALRQKINVCNKAISAASTKEKSKAAAGTESTAEKKKVRTHDTQGLAF